MKESIDAKMGIDMEIALIALRMPMSHCMERISRLRIASRRSRKLVSQPKTAKLLALIKTENMLVRLTFDEAHSVQDLLCQAHTLISDLVDAPSPHEKTLDCPSQ